MGNIFGNKKSKPHRNLTSSILMKRQALEQQNKIMTTILTDELKKNNDLICQIREKQEQQIKMVDELGQRIKTLEDFKNQSKQKIKKTELTEEQLMAQNLVQNEASTIKNSTLCEKDATKSKRKPSNLISQKAAKNNKKEESEFENNYLLNFEEALRLERTIEANKEKKKLQLLKEDIAFDEILKTELLSQNDNEKKREFKGDKNREKETKIVKKHNETNSEEKYEQSYQGETIKMNMKHDDEYQRVLRTKKIKEDSKKEDSKKNKN